MNCQCVAKLVEKSSDVPMKLSEATDIAESILLTTSEYHMS